MGGWLCEQERVFMKHFVAGDAFSLEFSPFHSTNRSADDADEAEGWPIRIADRFGVNRLYADLVLCSLGLRGWDKVGRVVSVLWSSAWNEVGSGMK